MSRRVVLFGLDGGTYSVLDDLVRRGVMPYLGEFMADGTRARLRSTVPPLTPPSWTTMVTGRSPGHHGITNFLQFESPRSKYIRLATSRDVRCPTLWSMVGGHGLRAGCLNFVAHSPAPKINGYVVPGWTTWRWMKKYSHPEGLFDRLQSEIPTLNIHDLGMDFNEERKAVAGIALEEYEPWIDMHIRREAQWFGILRHQLVHDPCAVVGIVFDGVDKMQHLLWPYLDPALEPHDPSEAFVRVRSRCWDYFRQLDGFLRETVSLVGPEGHVLIVSDHGFCGSREVLYINNWLEQEGYLTWAPGTPIQSEDSNELGRARPYHLTAFDLSRTRAYGVLASSNGIHIPVRGVKDEFGIEPAEYSAFREELIDALLTRCIDPRTGEPIVTRVWTREEVFAGPAMDLAPDLTVALRDHGFFSVLRSHGPLKERAFVFGTHHPDGVFIAHGPAVRRGKQIDPVRVLDITPSVLYTLGLPIPADLEGRPVTEIFSRTFTEAHAPQQAGAIGVIGGIDASDPALPALESEDEEQIMMRLKALGYIE